MKVFVLICESMIDYEQTIGCEVFGTRNEATSHMEHEYDDWMESNDFGVDQKVAVTDDSICVYEDGDYTRNHIYWAVYEKDTAPDEFQLPYMAITREDLYWRGYDTSKISDDTMQSIADDMSKCITEWGADWQTAIDETLNKFDLPRKEE